MRRNVRAAVVLPALLVVFAQAAAAAIIDHPKVDADFFNPSLGDRVGISFSLSADAQATVQILDRDGWVARTLLAEKRKAGPVILKWDGRTDSGEVVADEAYTLRILAGTEEYSPLRDPLRHLELQPRYYDRRSGTIAYDLPMAARVHLQVGISPAGADDAASGPVLKTVVNRAPRIAGSIVEQWNGYDESGTVYVPEQKDFVSALAATALPATTIIATGNRSLSFHEYAERRKGAPVIPATPPGHHHRGLNGRQDFSPALDVRVESRDRGAITVTASPSGPTAADFSALPGHAVVFVDYQRVATVRVDSTGTVRVPIDRRHLSSGKDHVITVNWASEFGPVAANSVRFSLGGAR
jgi:hypothetical protein